MPWMQCHDSGMVRVSVVRWRFLRLLGTRDFDNCRGLSSPQDRNGARAGTAVPLNDDQFWRDVCFDCTLHK